MNKPTKYEYILSKAFKVFAGTDEEADATYRIATEQGLFSDDIIVSMEVLNKIVTLDNGGEKHYVWNKEKNQWEITRYSLD